MRSPSGFAGTLALLVGVLVAAFAALTLGDGADLVIHLTLGTSFLLIAFAVFDFRLPAWVTVPACAAIGLLAIIFLLQGASDLTHAPSLTYLAYDLLGQRLEKLLGFVFVLWCLALVLMDSRGNTRFLGLVVIALVLAVEVYTYSVAFLGSSAPDVLKLLYIPLFVWLLLESKKRKVA